jgi:hypothetical protein
MSSHLVCLRNLEFGWAFQDPACDIQSQVSGTLVKGPRGVMRRAALQTRPRRHYRPDSVQDDKNTTLPHNPEPGNNLKAV